MPEESPTFPLEGDDRCAVRLVIATVAIPALLKAYAHDITPEDLAADAFLYADALMDKAAE